MSLEILYKTRDDYQRENFDSFLHAIDFKYITPSVHITGTNGKGSTLFYTASILEKAGYKVGIFNSPYLFNINDMILINNEKISDKELEEYVNKYEKLFNKFNLSSFEMMTFIALDYFDKKQCDIAVIECGMGGETDATNIFTPVISAITTISIEHSMFLGKSLSEIALQKSGIIKPTIPVVLGEICDEAKNVIKSDALNKNSFTIETVKPYNIEIKSESIFDYKNYSQLKLKSNANYSIKDACIAIEIIEFLQQKFSISLSDIYEGLYQVKMIARNEMILDKPCVILDGAHNPEAIENLVNSIEMCEFCRDIHIVFASFKDKNIALMLPTLSYLSNDITLTSFDHIRARKEDDYFLFLEEYKYNEDHIQIINDLIKNYPEDVIIITGSLAFASLVKKEFENGTYKE